MKFDIRPYVGVGSLRFGMSTEEVRGFFKRAGDPMRQPENRGQKLWIHREGLRADFDDEGRLESVEFSRDAEPTLFGVNLFGFSAEAAKKYLQLVGGGDLTVDRDGAQSEKLGVCLWIPYPDEVEEPAESVLVMSSDYYARWADLLKSLG
jgi:hypothetical protein